MNQRFMNLGFALGAGGLEVAVPTHRTRLPPSHYLLFVLSTAEVPSAAKIVQVG